MAIFLDTGIEGVLHQPRIPDSAGPPVFPDRKASRPLGIHEPSNLEKIFNTSYTRKLIDKMIYPNIPERDVMLPNTYNAVLTQLLKKVSTDDAKLNDIDPQKIKNAQTLLARMQENYKAFCMGRDQLIHS